MPHTGDKAYEDGIDGHQRTPPKQGGKWDYGFLPDTILKTDEAPETEEQRAMVKLLSTCPPDLQKVVMDAVKLRGYLLGSELIEIKTDYSPGVKT